MANIQQKNDKSKSPSNDFPLLATMIKIAPDYILSPSERTLFDWVLYTQHFLGKDANSFNSSIRRISEATGLNKTKIKTTLEKFAADGWLTISKGFWKNNQHTNIYADYGALIYEGNGKKAPLKKYIKNGTGTYHEVELFLCKWLKIQAIEDGEINAIVESLQTVFDARLQMYNEHHKQKYSRAQLPLTPEGKQKIKQFIRDRWSNNFPLDNNALATGFVQFADAILYKKVSTSDPINTYLWKDESGRYEHVELNHNTAVTYEYLNPEDYPEESGLNEETEWQR